MSLSPAFVVGMNGSGTTMLAESLGRHPDLYMFPFEVRVLPYHLKALRGADLGSLEARRRFVDALSAAKPFWHANGRQSLRLSDAALAYGGAANAVDALFQHFARQQGKARWGEKSPMNLLHLELLASVFPAARFVHIVRDGRDAAQSFHRRYGYCPEETVYRWKHVIERGRRQGIELGSERYLEIRYEALTESAEDGLRRVCTFLGLAFDPVMLNSSMRMMDEATAGGAQQIIVNSGKWQTYFSVREQVALEAIAGRQLAALGYSASVLGDAEPSPWRRLWWRGLGLTRRTARHFRRWGWAGLPGYLRNALASRKQSSTGR